MLDYDEVSWLRGHSPAWRLLRADNAPLILSFLLRVFVEGNVRSIAATELASMLDDDLYALTERLGAVQEWVAGLAACRAGLVCEFAQPGLLWTHLIGQGGRVSLAGLFFAVHCG